MITVNTRILSTVALGLALAACNNGGGSSKSNNPARPTELQTTKVLNSTQVTTKVEVTSDAAGNRVSRQYINTPAGDKLVVTLDGTTNKITGATLNGQPAVVGQNYYQAWANPAGSTTFDDIKPIGYVVYNSQQNGPTVLMSEKTDNTINDLSVAGYIRASKSGKTEFTGINYDYTYSNAEGKWQNVTGSDGKVTLEDGSSGEWNATFRDAQLKGDYYGKRVSGVATLNGVEGTFNGFDAYNPETKDHDTRGVFGGANNTSTFGGVWAKREVLQ